MKVAIYVVPIALAIYALFDLLRSEEHERAGLRPILWVLIIVLLPVVGPGVWIFVSTTRRAEKSSGPAPQQSRAAWPTRRPGPIAPDDDPDFLRKLDQHRKPHPGTDPTPEDGDPQPPDR